MTEAREADVNTAANADVEGGAVAVSRPREGVALVRILSEPLGVLRQGVKRALAATLAELEQDAAVRCMVLTGHGRAFSVGSDVREFRADASWQHQAALTDQGLNLALEEARFPIVAACNGLTLGGGAEMALACDIRLAGSSSRFGWPEVQVGAFASAGGTQRLPEHVGVGRAMELLLTGRMVDAQEALSIGLVQQVVRDEELEQRSIDLAAELASRSAMALAITKRCLVHGLRRGREAGHELENALTVELGLGDDAIEGQRAFLEKRTPHFNAR